MLAVTAYAATQVAATCGTVVAPPTPAQVAASCQNLIFLANLDSAMAMDSARVYGYRLTHDRTVVGHPEVQSAAPTWKCERA